MATIKSFLSSLISTLKGTLVAKLAQTWSGFTCAWVVITPPIGRVRSRDTCWGSIVYSRISSVPYVAEDTKTENSLKIIYVEGVTNKLWSNTSSSSSSRVFFLSSLEAESSSVMSLISMIKTMTSTLVVKPTKTCPGVLFVLVAIILPTGRQRSKDTYRLFMFQLIWWSV